MTQPDKDKKRHHEFDGIQEYDNDMPKWWINLFVITIIFGVLYFVWYHLPYFPSQSLLDEYYAASSAAAVETKSRNDRQATEKFDYSKASTDQAFIARGKETFTTTCAPCHASDGGGGVGPNLTDKFWLHGSQPAAIEASIANGVVEKGMPAWAPILGIDKVRELTAHIMTLKGTKPASPKEAQGTEE